MNIYLSHYISDKTPGYGGQSIFTCEESSSIKKGKSSNSSLWRMNNHSGTHIDFPKHFDDAGKTLSDYPANFWFFNEIGFINYAASSSEIIGVEQLNLGNINRETDFLIIKTNFEKFRGQEIYWNENPGFSPDLGHFLRNNFPKLRAIGFDSISLTSFQHRELGRQAHRAFLANYNGLEPILIVEDMKLGELNQKPKRVVCLPFMADDADGSPVTVTAELF